MPNPNSVDKSPHKDEIIDLLNEGWSAQRVLRYLTDRYHADDLLPNVDPGRVSILCGCDVKPLIS